MVAPAGLALGSVQWGMQYGVANRTGQPSLDELRRLLAVAAESGIQTIDTARSYGASEETIGRLIGADRSWHVITKLAAELPALPFTREQLVGWVRNSLDQSRSALGRACLDAVLLHRPVHRIVCDGAIWTELVRQRDVGTIKELGVSVVSPAEAEDLLGEEAVRIVQIPASLLDQRSLRSGLMKRLQNAGKRIVVRSIFLQGVAHLGWENLPGRLREHCDVLEQPLRLIRSWADAHSLRLFEAFLAFGLSLQGTTLLLGCETAAQLSANLDSCQRVAPYVQGIVELAGALPDLPECAINPAFWPAL